MKQSFFLLLLFLINIYFLYSWFKNWSRKRFIENIPSSKIRSMPMGLVEVNGIATAKEKFSSPFSNRPAAFYHYRVSVATGEEKGWRTVQRGSSEHLPFYLSDDSGRCIVLPTGAELEVQRSYFRTFPAGEGIPGRIRDFLEKWKIPHSDIFGHDRKLRIEEYLIREGEEIYIIGMCHDARHLKTLDEQAEIGLRIEALKENHTVKMSYDTNKDGELSPAEWQNAVNDIERQAKKSVNKEDHNLLYISEARGRDKVFIISNKSEMELLVTLKNKSILYLVLSVMIFLFALLLY